MIEVDVKIQAGDLYDYLLMHTYNGVSGLLGGCFGALLVVIAMMRKQWLLLAAGILVLLYLPWTLYVKSRKQVLQPMFQETLHYKLDEEGITISQRGQEQKLGWEQMVKAVSTSKSIIIYTSPVNATILPKRDLKDQKAAVMEVISTHMSPDKVKIKE